MKIRTKSIGVLTLTLLVAVAVSGCWATQSVGDLGVNDDDGLPPYGVITTQQAADVTVGVDDHVARVEDSATYFYHDDALETVTSLSDASGDEAASYEYDAWGNEWSWSASPTN